jgi:3-oxoacyl-[acyl-carrier-protein] synthase II
VTGTSSTDRTGSTDRTRVVVTGIGATTPVGGTAPDTWASMLAGRSGIRALTEDWAKTLPVRIAGRAAVEPTDVLSRVEARKLDRSEQFALVAAREAWRDAGYTTKAGEPVDGDAGPGLDPERVAVVVATGIGGTITLMDQYDVLKQKGARRVSPYTVPMLMPNGPAGWVSIDLGAKAGVHSPVSACASGNEALAWALDILRAGRADVVVAGGTEAAIHPLPIAAFASMTALSTRNDDPAGASRPYDSARDGFVLGEGAGVLVLETAEHAAARGVRVYAEVAGSGASSDAHHIAQPDPTGAGARRAMQLAVADARLDPAEVRHINAHATSTPQGDIAESLAIHDVLGAATAGAVVSATKSMTGHLLGATGAVEAIAVVMALHTRQVPPTLNLVDLDDKVDLDIAVGSPRSLPDGPIAALNNSFGFGGANLAVAFRSA